MRMLKDKIEFKKENQLSWDRNTYYWLNNPLRQVEDTKYFFKDRLSKDVKNEMTIIDMGCGSGWLLDFITDLKIKSNYIGLDFNPKFIEYLEAKFRNLSGVKFDFVDVEEPISDKYYKVADIVFNCFSFFENANLDAAFINAVKMLKENGKLVILTIDYTYLILALSKDMDDFKKNLKLYEEIKVQDETPYFFQNIDLGDSESTELKYASVLYSFGDYFLQANKHHLTLIDYAEIVKTSKFLPKTYQYMVFQKNN